MTVLNPFNSCFRRIFKKSYSWGGLCVTKVCNEGEKVEKLRSLDVERRMEAFHGRGKSLCPVYTSHYAIVFPPYILKLHPGLLNPPLELLPPPVLLRVSKTPRSVFKTRISDTFIKVIFIPSYRLFLRFFGVHLQPPLCRLSRRYWCCWTWRREDSHRLRQRETRSCSA